MFVELKHYKERFGDCNVPRRWLENTRLEQWVSHQRARLKQDKMTDEQRRCLEALGFAWDPRDAYWEEMFAELERYKERFGDCNVPQSWDEDPKLASWVSNQRSRRKDGRMTTEQLHRIDALGFVWHTKDAAWEEMFAELMRYKERFGDCDVRREWPEDPKLGQWVKTQRRQVKIGSLTDERRRRLEEIGFRF